MVNRGFTVAVEPPHSARSEVAVSFSWGREVKGEKEERRKWQKETEKKEGERGGRKGREKEEGERGGRNE